MSTHSDDEPQPEVVTYNGLPGLTNALEEQFGSELGLPQLNDDDLALLDDAIMLLTPPIAQVRVVEANTFTESEQSIVRGDVELCKGEYALSQKAVILRRTSEEDPAPPSTSETTAANLDAKALQPPASMAVAKDSEALISTALAPAAEPVKVDATTAGGERDLESGGIEMKSCEPAASEAATAAPVAVAAALGSDDVVGVAADAQKGGDEAAEAWQDMPEIILFWARNRRRAGNLVVCPNETSMNRLVQAYLVCEVVEHTVATGSGRGSSRGSSGFIKRKGGLLGVELGEALPSEQDQLQDLLSNYSFTDASLGVVSLLLSVYWFGIEGKNDVNVLTLLAVAVVAGLNQEATWPWVFNLIIRCSEIKDPMVKVTQCKRVHNHTGQTSGQAVLAIGLAAFGMWIELDIDSFPDGQRTPLEFNILLNTFQVAMIVVLLVNMVQAVSPMAQQVRRIKNILRPWAVQILEETVVDTAWYLTLLVAVLWAGVIAGAAAALFSGERELSNGPSVGILIAVVLVASCITINPGMFFLAVWGLVWLIPTGLAFIFRTAFDLLTRGINRAEVVMRRMTREWHAHVKHSLRGRFSIRDTLVLILQVVPLIPLLLLFVPLPLFWFLGWLVHVTMRMLLRLSDLIAQPVSPFCLYPLLSDWGSVTWRMAALDMEVERLPMRTMLKRRVSTLLEAGKLGKLVRSGTFPASFTPYSHLRNANCPRLGCSAIMLEVDEEEGKDVKILKICHGNSGDAGRRARERSKSLVSDVSNV